MTEFEVEIDGGEVVSFISRVEIGNAVRDFSGFDVKVPYFTYFWCHPLFWYTYPDVKTHQDLLDWANDIGYANMREWTRDNLSRLFDWEWKTINGENKRKFVLREQASSVRDHSIRVVSFDDSSQPPTQFLLASRPEQEDQKIKYECIDYYARNDYSVNAYCVTARMEDVDRIMGYSYRPDQLYFMFFEHEKDTRLFFGLELEMYTKLSVAELQYIVEHVEPKQERFFIVKDDGSLREERPRDFTAMELVTNPMSPRRMRKEFRLLFKKLESLAAQKGKQLSFYFKTNESCGIHIHVSGKAFDVMKSKTRVAYRASLNWRNKFASIWNLWDGSSTDFIEVLAKRARNTYCAVHPDMHYKYLSYRLRNGASDMNGNRARYSTCRDTGNTLEVRAFSSLFDINHVLYCIDVVESMYWFARDVPLGAIGKRFKKTYTNWLSSQTRFRNVKKELSKCA